MAFGGAGPLAANAVGKLLGAWPVIIPPSPGVLCAYGDATTKLSHELSTSYIKILSKTTTEELRSELEPLREGCEAVLRDSLHKISEGQLKAVYEVDLRYQGQVSGLLFMPDSIVLNINQAITLTIQLNEEEIQCGTAQLTNLIRERFNEAHTQQFSFSLDSHEVELMRLRAKVTDDSPDVDVKGVEGDSKKDPPESAIVDKKKITVEGKSIEAVFWNRGAINHQGYVIHGPAVITEMDANTLILPGCYGEIDKMGNILIRPLEDTQAKMNGPKHTSKSAESIVAEDPLISTLVSSSLQSIRREMDSLMLRCAMSPAIRDQQDEFNVIANPKGQMLVGQFGSFIPSFLEMWKGSIDEGDVFV